MDRGVRRGRDVGERRLSDCDLGAGRPAAGGRL